MWVKRIGLVLVYRSWVGVGCRSNRVVDHERRAVAKLHLAGGDDGLAFLDAGEDGHLVSTLQTGGNEDLPRDQLWAALRVLPLVIHHVDRLPVGIVGGGGLRKGEEALLAAGCDADACIHSMPQEPVWIFQCRADLDVAGCWFDLGVDRRDGPGEIPVRIA